MAVQGVGAGMRVFEKSSKLENVCYDIRGPVLAVMPDYPPLDCGCNPVRRKDWH
jgi:hypothetical protein